MSNNFPNMKPSDTQSEFGIFQYALQQYLGLNLGTVQPVEVVGVNGAFVNVKPLIQDIDTQGKAIEITDSDTINDVPAMKFNAGGCKIHYVSSVGDIGLLIACKVDISKFKKTKQKSTVGSYRKFNWSDGFFLPLSFEASSGFVLQNQNSTIELTSSAININGGTINLTGNVNLGGAGGVGVARIGDTVANGKITSGSSKVKAI